MSKELKLIGAGLGRTGITSLKRALKILGYTAYDNADNFAEMHGHMWKQAMHTGSIEGPAHALQVGEFDAVLDDPANYFAIDFLKMYPNAKVILTTRESADWLLGSQTLIDKLSILAMYPIRTFENYKVFSACMNYYWIDIRNCTDAHYESRPESCLAHYEAHNARIRQLVPPAKLLEFNVAEGWHPLCQFLDVPVPDVPFPHIPEYKGSAVDNDAMLHRIWQYRGQLAIRYGAVALGIGYFAVPFLKERWAQLCKRRGYEHKDL
jgi:hypothetical protein